MNVLVVDDDDDTAALLALLFEREGWVVDTAATVDEARRALDGSKHSVLVTDLNLPDGSGLSLLEGNRPPSLRVAILVTGAQDERQRERSRALGFNRCMTKPIAADDIISSIRKYAEAR